MFKFFSYHLYNIGVTIDKGKKVWGDEVLRKNDYIEIKGEIYKILGVNSNKHTLVLEKTDSSQTQLLSTQKGYKPYDFQGEEFTTGVPISLESLKGKYVLLDFWAEWCDVCIKEIPALKELYSKTDREKFEIIGIVGQSKPDAIKKLIDMYEIDWPQILSDEIVERYKIRRFPSSLILDKEGIVISSGLLGRSLEEKILSLLEK